MIKSQSFRRNPEKPSVVKEHGLWWARARTSKGMWMSAHGSQPEAFEMATEVAGYKK